MSTTQTRKHPHTGRDVTGTLHDCGAWVSDEAVVGERVRPLGPATIWGGTIWGGDILGGDIHGGDIHGGDIRGGDIRGGTILGGTILGGTIWGGTISGGDIRGGDIRHTRDVLVISPVGSENKHVTLVRTDDSPHHLLRVGCWPDGRTGAHIDGLAGEVRRRCPDHGPEYAEIELLLRRRIAEWTPAGDA